MAFTDEQQIASDQGPIHNFKVANMPYVRTQDACVASEEAQTEARCPLKFLQCLQMKWRSF